MIHPTAIVNTNRIGTGTRIHEFAIVRENVILGNNVIIHPHVIIDANVIIEDNVEIFPGSYIGKKPNSAGATSRSPTFQPHLLIQKNCAIGPYAVIFYDVEIGENTLIGDGASIREQCRIGDRCIISRHVTINYHTVIGHRVKIMDLTHLTGNMIIEDDVFISTLVASANDNNMNKESCFSVNIWKGPHIKKGASIGANATLLPGVCIGQHAVVGAGAVVSKDVKAYTLVMGVPARFVCDLQEVL